MARPASFDRETLTLVCSALSRGNSKTDGFKTRSLPLSGKVVQAIGPRQAELFQLARDQMGAIDAADKALAGALALAAAGGDREKIKKETYSYASAARAALDRAADTVFFEHLWARFAAQEFGDVALEAEQRRFARFLRGEAERVFEAALPTMPCETGVEELLSCCIAALQLSPLSICGDTIAPSSTERFAKSTIGIDPEESYLDTMAFSIGVGFCSKP